MKVGEVGMRLIDADELKARIIVDAPGYLDGGSSITKAFILAMLGTRSATPTIDAVPVVRCKYCAFRDPRDGMCEHVQQIRDPDWYCADGERRYDDG